MIADILSKSGLTLGKIMEYSCNGKYNAKQFTKSSYVGFVPDEEQATEVRKENRFYKFVTDQSEADYNTVLVSHLPHNSDKEARKVVEVAQNKNLIILQVNGERPIEWFESIVGETTSRVYHIRQNGLKYSLYIWLR